MRRAVQHLSVGTWPDGTAIATVTLAFDDRHRRRIALDDDSGQPFLLDLPAPALLADGDGLALDGGGFIRVRAAAEPVLDVRGHGPAHVARLAWHIGNRHVPVQVLSDGGLRIRDDHVLAAMLEGLGATVERKCAPFAPEPGAYAAGHGHGHDHHHGHGHGG